MIKERTGTSRSLLQNLFRLISPKLFSLIFEQRKRLWMNSQSQRGQELHKLYSGYFVKLVVLIIRCLGGARHVPLSSFKGVSQMQKAMILGSLSLLRAHDLWT